MTQLPPYLRDRAAQAASDAYDWKRADRWAAVVDAVAGVLADRRCGFEAQYRGECDACDEPINVGDLIEKNGFDCYVHHVCPEVKDTKFKGTTDEEMGY